MTRRHYRVAQWATGNIGLYTLRAVIDHPRYDLVGVRVYSDAKAGRDAGDLCGRPPTGIIATQDVDAIIAARPDCILYMPDRPEIETMCRLLAAGINLASAITAFCHRDSIPAADRQALEAACVQGGASLYCTGSTPGYSTEVLPLAFTAIMRRIDCITQSEACDVSSRNSPEMLFELLGFGRRPEEVPQLGFDPARSIAPSMRALAEALALPLDAVTCSHDYAVARTAFNVAAGRIEAGTIAAIRMEISGMRGGRVLIRRRATWFLGRDIEPAWELPEVVPAWHYRLEGDVPLDIAVTKPIPEANYPLVSPGLTANPVLNAISHVCAAPPGIRQTDELPMLIGDFGQP
ncbi:MAG: dihydrodipicolinate reductase [Sphingobium sp.]